MPEVRNTTYTFSYQEVLAALVRQARIHEGRWQLTMAFGTTAVHTGPEQGSAMPGTITAVTGIGLEEASATSPEALTIDASVANPKP